MVKSKYVQEWLPQDDKLQPFYKEIDEFVNNNLPEISDEVEYLTSKIIADPLLGYIHFTGLEIFIIDTPLYQRLRNIKQLGLANLVFPSLSYSRFEHSLGVVGRMNQILIKLKENYLRSHEDDAINKTIDKYLTSIRLAALLHDIGHCLFSHCSERVINKLPGRIGYPSSEEIREIFSNHFGKKGKIPFAEVFSLAIIGSKSFLKYLTASNLHTENNFKNYLKMSGRFILGLPDLKDPNSLFISQLMSSGLDADKIDYMTREQLYSGIKLEIDLDRIFSKLNVFTIDSLQMPENLYHIKLLFSSDTKFQVLGFSRGGQFSFEEFCIARLALHVKIYLHQKVRSAESQIENYLNYLTQLEEYKTPVKWLDLPEDIINYPDIILNTSKGQLDLFQSSSLIPIDPENFYAIKKRKLFLRAFAFGPINSFSESKNAMSEEDIQAYFSDLNVSELKRDIVKRSIEISKVLRLDIKEKKFEEFIIDLPRLINIQQGHQSLFFERAKYSLVKWTIPIDKIMLYFQENRALAYVFAPIEISPILCLAAEQVINKLNSKIYDQENMISNVVYLKYNELKNLLTLAGYYNNLPQLKSVSKYLQSAAASEKIKIIDENLASFKSLDDERITLSTILTFCNQFPLTLQDAILSLLTHVIIYQESALNTKVEEIIKKIGKNQKIGAAFLGGSTDSGSKLSYNLRSTFEKYNIESPSAITDSLIDTSDYLIIFDDNINSGLQLINILGQLLDEKSKIPKEMILNEDHIKPLMKLESKKKIREIEIYFAYTIGFESVEEKIKEQLYNIFGFEKEKIHVCIKHIFKENEKVFSGSNHDYQHGDKKLLMAYLQDIGSQLLTSEKKKKSKIDSCKLGYAGAEALALFPYNVPTMTITALWCAGTLANGSPWIPLARRRRRHNNNGEYIGED